MVTGRGPALVSLAFVSWLLFLAFCFCFLPMENIRSTWCHEAYFSLVVSVAGFFMSTVSTMPYSFASGAVIQ